MQDIAQSELQIFDRGKDMKRKTEVTVDMEIELKLKP
jgi:hypothetical protein